jgi:SAM-dependent methyltransferase
MSTPIMKGVNFGPTASDYARFRAGAPASVYERIARFGIGRSGQRAVDLGTGTGTLGRGFAERGCVVCGVDRSPEMVEQATQLAEAVGVTISYRVAPAEQTGLPAKSWDAVSAAQAWHWFDPIGAAKETKRLLVDGGSLVLVYHDWVVVPGNLPDVTEELIAAHNPSWSLRGKEALKGAALWMKQLAVAGFHDLETFSYDEAIPYSHAGWRGRIRASAGVGASLSAEAVAHFDRELAALLTSRFPDDPQPVPHRVFVLVGRS